jgi:SAM-dependent methyltransferase
MSILSLIESWIEDEDKVLDLGCGDGKILAELKLKKNIAALGVEIEDKNIETCLIKGINVIEQNIDNGLSNFTDDSFEIVIMSQTIQVLKKPDFGNWRSRLALLFTGKMPITNELPDRWNETPNIHLCTLKDFEDLCEDIEIIIEERISVNSKNEEKWYLNLWPNLLSSSAIYKISK